MADRQTVLSSKEHVEIYKALIVPRKIEEKMLILLRQGRISKWFSGYGQEAVSVGTTLAMHDDEFICTMHRNLGVFTTRNVPLDRLFAQFQGKMEGFTKGRDRSFHFGSKEHKIVGMISHLGPQLGVADGLGLAHKIKKEKKVAMVYTGDGGASEGDFHEALNVASVWQLPVLFVIENNQWGLSTPSREQFNFDSFVVKGPAYGMEAHSVDGNDIEEVYTKTRDLTESIRNNPRPIILECKTFRIRGHEEASGTKYYPDGLIDEWSKADPVDRYEAFLKESGILSEEEIEAIQQETAAHIASSIEKADSYAPIEFMANRETEDLFAPFENDAIAPKGATSKMRMIDAIHDALDAAMDQHPELVLMGQDIADYGGVFKATDGLMDKYGKDRVRNTPLCEAAIVGTALGLSIQGQKAMMEMQFADFVTEGFTQIVNNLAKIHWRWGQNADVVVRMPTGAGVAAGPFHSQSNEAWFTHTPGLKVVYPSNPADAKGLLLQSFRDPNPVMFFEHKGIYRSGETEVPEGYYTLPFGEANVVNEGSSLTIVTYGKGVGYCKELIEAEGELSDIELIDLRTLVPWDKETIIKSVQKTGRVLLVSEDVKSGGFINDIAQVIQEECFSHLDAPVRVLTSMDTPVPFAEILEKGFLPWQKLKGEVESILAY
ncbi:MAG: dehydrogenase [Flavobacteriia bacterium]|nr:dehydrogenase [Flavobacteriia bacterium]